MVVNHIKFFSAPLIAEGLTPGRRRVAALAGYWFDSSPGDTNKNTQAMNNRRNDAVIFSKAIAAGTRVYYFDCRQGPDGEDYLQITEFNMKDGRPRQRIFVHKENFEVFEKTMCQMFASLRERTERNK